MLYKMKRIKRNLEELCLRMDSAKRLDKGVPTDTIHFTHLYAAIMCDVSMVIEDMILNDLQL